MAKKVFLVLCITFSLCIKPALIYAEESLIKQEKSTVGKGDMLIISVRDHDELKTIATVAADGSISFPYIGVINVKGMGLSDIESEISKRLASYVKRPVVTVNLQATQKQKYFYVYGESNKPGQYILEENMTVFQAISEAGGITQNGLYGDVTIRRNLEGKEGHEAIDVYIRDSAKGKINGDLLVKDNDVIVIEPSKGFFVYGEVSKPGKYVLEDDMSVLKAISLAGGFAKFGSPDRVKILRKEKDKGGYQCIKVNIKGALSGKIDNDIRLEPGDILAILEGIL